MTSLASTAGDTELRHDTRLGVARRAFVFGILTASFDVFLTINVAGFNLRAHQVLMVLPLAYAAGLAFSDQKIRVPLGAFSLYVWVIFIFAFIPNTMYVPRSIGYGAWLLLDTMIIILTVQLFDNIEWLRVLLKWYLRAFLLVSIVGLAQLVLGVSHLPAPYVRQWLIGGVWPRLNGFSYEPSYYSTYLLMGWVYCAWILEKGNDFLQRRLVLATFGTSTAALFLSTSRMGWVMMALWGCGYAYRRLMRFGSIRISLGSWLVTINICLLLAAGLGAAAAFKSQRVLQFFAGGTGLFGTPAHSVTERESRFWNTLHLVNKSPFIGYSLGGVATALGESEGSNITDAAGAKAHEGMTVFAEVLAASGVIGFIPFIVYICTLFVAPLRLARGCPEPYRTVLIGLVWGLAIEIIMLQFNQNILRPYLWFHIAVLSATYAVVREYLRRNALSARA